MKGTVKFSGYKGTVGIRGMKNKRTQKREAVREIFRAKARDLERDSKIKQYKNHKKD